MKIRIGLLIASKVEIRFIGVFHNDKSEIITGDYTYDARNLTAKEEIFIPEIPDSSFFEVKNIIIGKDFHWQRKETQRFKGNLILRNNGKDITLINILSVEDYLVSVISSEMCANASLEFLKAHAVISRSWVVARILHRNTTNLLNNNGMIDTPNERIRWYDDSQHIGFDVCADDHCQRYQGVTRITNHNAINAVKATEGIILTYKGEIADTRFSKCCGGAFEKFENCWDDTPHPYLAPGIDYISANINKHSKFDLTKEENTQSWIETEPTAFCNTQNREVLSQVLNVYDLETTDFYRWKKEYTPIELSEIVRERSGIDFGMILHLIPMQRGVSGRIIRLKIVGSKRTMVIGKELEIRRILSRSHLYSSAFTITKEITSSSTDSNYKFIFHGAGWGHGVGLCQIGAAMMAHKGYNYKDILHHYYRDCELLHISRL
ncbi:MAG: SpoIID/LytB domain-containing protein [Bacteroides sp.]|nr:SpoIID/LytB domain-containing protein [Bacteroides sp.]